MDKGKATYTLPGGDKKHRSLERGATIATLVNMAEVLSIAEGNNRRFNIAFSQKLARLPGGPGQRHVFAHLSDEGVPLRTSPRRISKGRSMRRGSSSVEVGHFGPKRGQGDTGARRGHGKQDIQFMNVVSLKCSGGRKMFSRACSRTWRSSGMCCYSMKFVTLVKEGWMK